MDVSVLMGMGLGAIILDWLNIHITNFAPVDIQIKTLF